MNQREALKRWFYHVSRSVGLFHVSRLLSRNALRILCYHGFPISDEQAFRPGLYLSAAEFSKRMDFLRRKKYPVLELTDAIERLAAGRLPPGATVITIDDGFYSSFLHAFPILQRCRFPATLYLTTYYFNRPEPVFNLAVSYMLWKTSRRRADLSRLGIPSLQTERQVRLTDRETARLAALISEHGAAHCDSEARDRLARQLGKCLDVDYQQILKQRLFGLVNEAELLEMAARNVDVQLHTHRHRLPAVLGDVVREVQDNRAALEPLLNKRARHFCYPSGDWVPQHWSMLESQGISTAVTCDPGLVHRGSPPLALRRISDSCRVSQIEFEAEMSGYSEMIRLARAFVGRVFATGENGRSRLSEGLQG